MKAPLLALLTSAALASEPSALHEAVTKNWSVNSIDFDAVAAKRDKWIVTGFDLHFESTGATRPCTVPPSSFHPYGPKCRSDYSVILTSFPAQYQCACGGYVNTNGSEPKTKCMALLDGDWKPGVDIQWRTVSPRGRMAQPVMSYWSHEDEEGKK